MNQVNLWSNPRLIDKGSCENSFYREEISKKVIHNRNRRFTSGYAIIVRPIRIGPI